MEMRAHITTVEPMRDDLKDEVLVGRVKHGDMEALGELYRRYGLMVKGALFRFANGISEAEAEELSQDVFLELLESAAQYKDQGRFRAWLYGVAVNLARRWRRRHGLTMFLFRPLDTTRSAVLEGAGNSPEQMVVVRESVSRALAGLPQGLRDVLVLYEVEGFGGEEIADILDIKIGAVWTRLHRARKRIIEKARPAPVRALSLEGK